MEMIEKRLKYFRSEFFVWIIFVLLYLKPVMGWSQLTLQPSGSSSEVFTSFQTAYQAGDQLMHQNGWKGAIQAYQQAVSLTTNHYLKSVAENSEGWAWITLHNYSRAKRSLKRAIHYDSSNKVALSNLGVVYYRMYEFGLEGIRSLKQAIKYFKKCNAIDANYHPELLIRAQEDLDDVDSWAQATPIPSRELRKSLSYQDSIALGDQAQSQGQLPLALKAFQLAAREAHSMRSKASAINRQGKAWLDYHFPSKALSYFKQAVKLEPNQRIYLNNLGFTYWEIYDSGLGNISDLIHAVNLFYRVNALGDSYRIENFKMALAELQRVDPKDAQKYEVLLGQNGNPNAMPSTGSLNTNSTLNSDLSN
jgi:tetratricopeptide (TPR) repeat protein